LRGGDERDAHTYVDSLLTNLSCDYGPDSRLFFEFTFAKIIENWRVWQDKENRFTSNRLLAYTQDLCLFAEDMLRRKGFGDRLRTTVRKMFNVELGEDCDANSFRRLNSLLKKHLKKRRPLNRCFRTFITLRNFSSHNVAGGNGKDFFYSDYERVLMEILRSIVLIHEKLASSSVVKP
jgi:hypothetical protein